MGHKPLSLFHQNVLNLRLLFVMLYKFCVLTTAEYREKIWCQLMHLIPSSGLMYYPFLGGGSVVVNVLFIVISVFVGVCT